MKISEITSILILWFYVLHQLKSIWVALVLITKCREDGHYLCHFQRKGLHRRFTSRWALGCEKFVHGPAWLLLSKTGPTFSASL